ncbi:hypothetical protein DPMN_179198 [Dreissena polymorpha]|uniref:Uncharacterized protein n=1 Tax=Dreissena polymorpha TaxID=45954 RepID=A0A9D4EGI9_DREPO|nr:hypothetical protein DPMN_179198 [Dreissena polymorpha]
MHNEVYSTSLPFSPSSCPRKVPQYTNITVPCGQKDRYLVLGFALVDSTVPENLPPTLRAKMAYSNDYSCTMQM